MKQQQVQNFTQNPSKTSKPLFVYLLPMTITNNLYVRLDEVTKIIFRKMPLYSSIYDELTLDTIKEVSSLPTINLSQDSTLSEIDEIIEGYNETERR